MVGEPMAIFTGGTRDYMITGGGGNAQFYGGSDDNLMIGSGGNDYFVGGTGVNAMMSGSGNDTSMVTNAFAVVVDPRGGINSVVSYIHHYEFPVNTTNLYLANGSSAVTGYGNNLDDTIVGIASGDNYLDGVDGKYWLSGGTAVSG